MKALNNLLNTYFTEAKKKKHLVETYELAEEIAQIISKDLNPTNEESYKKTEKIIQIIFDRLMTAANGQSGDIREPAHGFVLLNYLINLQFFLTEETFKNSFAFLHKIFINNYLTDEENLFAAALYGSILSQRGKNAGPEVDLMIEKIIVWLEANSNDHLTLVAVLVLKEISLNSPTLFNVHLIKLLAPIWSAIRSPKIQTREAALSCIRSIVLQLEKRDLKQKSHWFKHIYDEAMEGLQKYGSENAESSITVMGELLSTRSDLMQPLYDNTVKKIMLLLTSRDRKIIRVVTKVVPLMANYDPGRFKKMYEASFMKFLLNVLKTEKNKDFVLLAIGKTVAALQEKCSLDIKLLMKHLTEISNQWKVTTERKQQIDNVFECVSLLAQNISSHLKPFSESLIQMIFYYPLCERSIEALHYLHESIPELRPTIEARISLIIVNILKDNMHQNKKVTSSLLVERQSLMIKKALDENSDNPIQRKFSVSKLNMEIKENSSNNVALALKTIRSFHLQESCKLPSVKSLVSPYLENPNVLIRKETALSCSSILLRICANIDECDDYTITTVIEILDKVVTLGITDENEKNRLVILDSLREEYDIFLAQNQFLNNIFIALNDESLAARKLAIKILGRLINRNPILIYPTLRGIWVRLLSEIRFSKNSIRKEESVVLLAHMLKHVPKIFKNYTHLILDSLMPNVNSEEYNHRIATGAIDAIGALAEASGENMRPFQKKLIPMIIRIFRNKNSKFSRDVSLKALRLMLQSTSDVVWPYMEYKDLMPSLLLSLQPENNYKVRNEACRIIGFLGAWDPAQFTAMIEKEKNSKNYTTEETQFLKVLPMIHKHGLENKNFACVAVNALIKILRDTGLSAIHGIVIESLKFIVQNSKDNSGNFVPKIVQTILEILFRKININKSNSWLGKGNSNDSLSVSLFHSLIFFVPLARQHMEQYLDDIIELIKRFWDKCDKNLFTLLILLLEEISKFWNDEFSLYLEGLVPMLLNTISRDCSKDKKPSLTALHALRTFVPNLQEHLFLVIPEVLGICERITTDAKLKKFASITLCKICETLNVKPFCSQIIRSQMRMFKKTSPNMIVILNTLLHVMFQLDRYQCRMFIESLENILLKENMKVKNYFLITKQVIEKKQCDYKALLNKVEIGSTEENEMDNLLKPDFEAVTESEMNQEALAKAWNINERSTREDWIDWLKNLMLELVKENPSPAIRHCYKVALKYPALARELFFPAFISCWVQLWSESQDDFIQNLEKAFVSSKMPQEVIFSMLNLVECFERTNLVFPVQTDLLGKLSEKIKSYAKTLHHKENEFLASPKKNVESIISIYNHLQQPESADGMLEYALKANIPLEESWYEKLRRWENALEAYERNTLVDKDNQKLVLGRLRCLKELGQSKRLLALSRTQSKMMSKEEFKELAPLAASAAWTLGEWDSMKSFVNDFMMSQVADKEDLLPDCSFLEAVLCVREEKFNEAEKFISQTRESLDSELSSLVGESYNRAYPVVVKLQKLVELEEVVSFKKLSREEIDSRELLQEKRKLMKTWSNRIKGCKRNVDVWSQLLSVRSLLLKPSEDVETYLRFSSLCRKKQLLTMSINTIEKLLDRDVSTCKMEDILKGNHPSEVKYAYLKHLWDAGIKSESLEGILTLADSLNKRPILKAKCFVKHGEWQSSLLPENYKGPVINKILDSFTKASELDKGSYKAFHSAAMFAYRIALTLEEKDDHEGSVVYLVPAVRNFFTSLEIDLHSSKTFFRFQDALRVLNILFNHGTRSEVRKELLKGLESSGVGIWMTVIPQIIARVKDLDNSMQKLIRFLLLKIGKSHPQALIYPLMVAKQSHNEERSRGATRVLDLMKEHSPVLVEQALLVSSELIRVAVLWPEMCMDEMKEASRCYLRQDYGTMCNILEHIHGQVVEGGKETNSEIEFHQAFAHSLSAAFDHIREFKATQAKNCLDEAWGVYCQIFKQLQNKVDSLTDLALAKVSPKLLEAEGLELYVPGMHMSRQTSPCINSFSPNLRVIKSKRKPRKLSMRGSDGRLYTYILKGREDIRQDERVMQFLGLVNTIFEQSPEIDANELAIRRYAVIPLSPITGLIEWVPGSDTLYELIRQYRERHGIEQQTEAQLMKKATPHSSKLMLPQKMQLFESISSVTTGDDLKGILWENSADSETWFEWRSCYTRSLAVMSMVGYVLGLGDRHPSNLMIERSCGKVVHIDFGDCFEVAAERTTFPEKVPFRLTKMMVRAMGVSGVEGLFRRTCETVMRVLRENRESLMAVLEAFVYDPIINWRLIEQEECQNDILQDSRAEDESLRSVIIKTFSVMPNSNQYRLEKKKDNELLNQRSIKVMKRISAKLTGRDFGCTVLNPKQQVQELVQQATSPKNLCQFYSGWCAYW